MIGVRWLDGRIIAYFLSNICNESNTWQRLLSAVVSIICPGRNRPGSLDSNQSRDEKIILVGPAGGREATGESGLNNRLSFVSLHNI